MPVPEHSLPENYFNDVYQAHDDPWNFEASEYERGKYQTTVAALPKPLYQQVFEIGCSIGVLSQMLAPKCQHLLSVDIADAPLLKAKHRLQNFPQVTVQKMTVPHEFPEQQFDLILMSEVGYYLALPDLKKLQQQITDHLQVGGHLLLVHWTPFVHDYPLTGDQVHEQFLQLCGPDKPFKHVHGQHAETYRLDLLERQ
ncbi:methyltransferase [Mucilaginibacter robiniae]|uniref:Methyltransferase n=1 Tax=Mucilaginibacter robiniae TaxID=2728022 RepID=A0A7L5DYF6_9SPHI|nr:SAM-dependent methyltransferase [Mucilaginibacter robiniae]QJD95069.1 methyltransferase [Mucilaginibacter robiniae]